MSIIGTLAAPPATIGRYELREHNAHGGMGVLHLAFDPLTAGQIALEVRRVERAELRERSLHEARLAARRLDPDIVTIYDGGAHADQPCIAMEFIAVHRDVKPASLTISRDSGGLEVLDVGVAGRLDAVFAVGPGLDELLTCHPACSGPSQQSILLEVLHESPTPLTTLLPDVDPAVPAIVARALEKSVDRRYADLEAISSDLSRVGRRRPAAASSHDAAPATGAEPRVMRRDDEVAHYLSRARRRLEAGDVTAAPSPLDAALDVTCPS